MPCSPAIENEIGPIVSSSCLDGFDFTLLFEESILVFLPLVIASECIHLLVVASTDFLTEQKRQVPGPFSVCFFFAMRSPKHDHHGSCQVNWYSDPLSSGRLVVHFYGLLTWTVGLLRCL